MRDSKSPSKKVVNFSCLDLRNPVAIKIVIRKLERDGNPNDKIGHVSLAQIARALKQIVTVVGELSEILVHNRTTVALNSQLFNLPSCFIILF